MTRKGKRPAPITILRRITREIRASIALLAGARLDDRGRGQLEALRHVQTVLEDGAKR